MQRCILYGVAGCVSMKMFLSWRDGSVGEVLAAKARRPEFNPQHPSQTQVPLFEPVTSVLRVEKGQILTACYAVGLLKPLAHDSVRDLA